jgi:hypothetical protein
VDIQQWFTKLKDKFQHDLPKWNPNVFIVDDINVEINIIKYKSFFLTPTYLWDKWKERWTPLPSEGNICIYMNSTGKVIISIYTWMFLRILGDKVHQGIFHLLFEESIFYPKKDSLRR